MYMFFGFMTALISIGAGVLIVLIIIRGVNRSEEIKQQTYMKTLEKGIYDYRLIGGKKKKSSGTAVLGWGIFFVSIGVALFISFIALGIIAEAMAGTLVPLFIGVGLIIYYAVRGRSVDEAEHNGEPVTFKPPTEGSKMVIAGDE